MRRGLVVFFFAGVLSAQIALHGVVKDTTGVPVSDISVTAHPLGVIGKPVSSLTDEAGRYTFTGLPPGTYLIRAERDNATRVATLEDVKEGSTQIKLDADQEITLDLVIPANPSISGHVWNQNKEPLVDAFVWLLKGEYQAGILRQTLIGPQVTGEDGTYTFETGLEANRRYVVLVDRPPPDELVPAAAADLKDRELIEVPTYYPSATTMESAAPVVLQPGERREQVDIKIATAPFYCIDGKIQVSGKPSSYSFAIQDSSLTGTNLARLRSSAAEDGTFHACGLSPGSYRLSTLEGSTEFAVSNSDMHHVDLSVESAHLRLQVDWDGDAPPPEAPPLDAASEATLRKIASQAGMGDTVSDDDLKKLAIRVAQRLTRPDPDDKEFSKLLNDLITNPDTAVEMGKLAGNLRPSANMVNVTLGNATSNPLQQLMAIPSEGPFRDAIPPGEYIVDVRSLSLRFQLPVVFTNARAPVAMGATDSYVKEVTYANLKLAEGMLRIGPAASGTLRVLMAYGTATLAVSVTDTEGKPVPDATVMVIPDSATSAPLLSRLMTRGQADENGNYTSPPLAPGKYRVLATSQRLRWAVPEDLEKLLPVSFQANPVELASQATGRMTVPAVPIY